MDEKMLFVALGLAYMLGAATGPFWADALKWVTYRMSNNGFEDYYPDDFKPRRRRRRRRRSKSSSA